MGEVVEIGLHLSVNEFCDEARCDNLTITRRLKAAGIKPSAKKGKQNRYRLADLLRCAYLMDDDGNFNPSGLDPFKRKAHFQAAQEEVKYRQECGELVPKIEMETEFARAMKVFARFCDTLPDILERDAGATPAQVSMIEKRIDQARAEFVRALSGEDETEDESTDGQSSVRAGT
jgi:hypothetical protein